MKKYNFILISLSILFCSCEAIYINEITKSKDFKLNKDNSSSAIVNGRDNVKINEFIKTYHKKYNTNQEFENDFVSEFCQSLKFDGVFSKVKNGVTSQIIETGEIIKSTDSNDYVDANRTNIDIDYIINIVDFEISNRIQYSTMGGGPNMPMTTTSTEYCVINAHIEVVNARTNAMLLDFVSKGEGTVVFFAYESALVKAISKSIEHAVKYIETGKIAFIK